MIKVVSNRSFRKKEFAEPVETVDLYSQQEIKIKKKKFNRSGRIEFNPAAIGGDGAETNPMRKSLLFKDKDKKMDFDNYKKENSGPKKSSEYKEGKDEGKDLTKLGKVRIQKRRSRNSSLVKGIEKKDETFEIQLYAGEYYYSIILLFIYLFFFVFIYFI